MVACARVQQRERPHERVNDGDTVNDRLWRFTSTAPCRGRKALAERAGLSVYGIQKLEAGTTHPYRDTAQRVALALGLTSEVAELGAALDMVAVEEWIHAMVAPIGPIEMLQVRPWATVLRVPLDGRAAWFKACAPLQAFEPRLTAELYARWPDRVAEVLAHDEQRAWAAACRRGSPSR